MIINIEKEDLERPVNKFVSILIGVLFACPLIAQSDSIVSVADSLAVEDVVVPNIEYSMQPKTYEIADIRITGADSYEDFVLIGFSGLAVGDKIEVPGEQITKSLKRFWKQGLFSDVKFKATKIEGDKIIGCDFCKFRDICFVKNRDKVSIIPEEFGGITNGMD